MAVVAFIAEPDADLLDEMVFADVERLRSRLACALGAGVTVAASVGRAPVVPVRVQTAIADTAVDQPSQGEPARLAVTGRSRGPDLLSVDEVLFGDERRMCSLRRQSWH
ncbi:hypothetical protein [Amycolatopsis kentuckyensis]|uniref:hypothetical protein n=1 Tax=Amycolatopsis kentuckyensis TaxID=218823 RepID=UPI001FCA0194|nr:hypothetical protein [Amycolatopsis kentuckyensis]